jgi:hypothetical protein
LRGTKAAADSIPRVAISGDWSVIKSQSNTAQRYQRMLDHLAESASAGDWDAVRATRIKESDNYAKIVMDYRTPALAGRAEAGSLGS